VGVASDQAVELFGVDLVAGEPELHFDLVMAQLPERYALVAARQRQRLAQQALQPLAEGGIQPVQSRRLQRWPTVRSISCGLPLTWLKPSRPPIPAGHGGRCRGSAPREAVDIAAVGRDLAQHRASSTSSSSSCWACELSAPRVWSPTRRAL
jgi:hypothetical protein